MTTLFLRRLGVGFDGLLSVPSAPIGLVRVAVGGLVLFLFAFSAVEQRALGIEITEVNASGTLITDNDPDGAVLTQSMQVTLPQNEAGETGGFDFHESVTADGGRITNAVTARGFQSTTSDQYTLLLSGQLTRGNATTLDHNEMFGDLSLKFKVSELFSSHDILDPEVVRIHLRARRYNIPGSIDFPVATGQPASSVTGNVPFADFGISSASGAFQVFDQSQNPDNLVFDFDAVPGDTYHVRARLQGQYASTPNRDTVYSSSIVTELRPVDPHFWGSGVDDAFSTHGWLTQSANPQPDEKAVIAFDRPNFYTVDFKEDAAVSVARIESGGVTFDMNLHQLVLKRGLDVTGGSLTVRGGTVGSDETQLLRVARGTGLYVGGSTLQAEMLQMDGFMRIAPSFEGSPFSRMPVRMIGDMQVGPKSIDTVTPSSSAGATLQFNLQEVDPNDGPLLDIDGTLGMGGLLWVILPDDYTPSFDDPVPTVLIRADRVNPTAINGNSRKPAAIRTFLQNGDRDFRIERSILGDFYVTSTPTVRWKYSTSTSDQPGRYSLQNFRPKYLLTLINDFFATTVPELQHPGADLIDLVHRYKIDKSIGIGIRGQIRNDLQIDLAHIFQTTFTGSIFKPEPGIVQFNTGSPIEGLVELTSEVPVDAIGFDLAFDEGVSESAVFTVSIDGITVAAIAPDPDQLGTTITFEQMLAINDVEVLLDPGLHQVRFRLESFDGSAASATLSNVRLIQTTTIPEPTSIVLLLAGGLALLPLHRPRGQKRGEVY